MAHLFFLPQIHSGMILILYELMYVALDRNPGHCPTYLIRKKVLKEKQQRKQISFLYLFYFQMKETALSW